MTLTARGRPPAHHKKISGAHHRHTKSYHKPYWPYLPLLAIVLVGVVLNNAWPGKHSVLGYSTDMSIQELVDGTNSQRTSNGLGSLSLNNQLAQAAQAKANDMVAQNYWAHNNPQGKTPWQFITEAGYTYATAGENLAYGFNTAGDTITGWMNSPEHRANILNTSYVDVGFGFANSPNFQSSGQETIIVAEYASPVSGAASTPAATPAASPPAATQSTQSTPTASTPTAAATPSATPTAVATTTPVTAPTSTTQTTTASVKTVPEDPQQPVTRVQLLTAGNASWSMLATTTIVLLALFAFLLRHGLAWHKFLRRGERFVLKHQMLDVIAITLVVIGFVLTRTTGVIR